MSQQNPGHKARQVWLFVVALSLPFVLVIMLAVHRKWVWNHSLPESGQKSHDPTDMVPEYIAQIDHWKNLPFVDINFSMKTNLINIPGFVDADLDPGQKDLLLEKLDDLVQAHKNGDSVALRRVMLPGDDKIGIKFTQWGAARTSSILDAAKTANSSPVIVDKDPWTITAASWKWLVVKWGLTNWWQAVSLDNSRVVVIKVDSIKNIPSVASTNYYGEFAGTGAMPSLLLYPSFHSEDHTSNASGLVVVGVRLLVRIHNHENKPIPYVFRWRWSSLSSTWYPYDYCEGSVARDGPQPFF
jgi:hypothetical protein